MKLSLLSDNHIFHKLIEENEHYFDVFCHKCFKMIGKDYSSANDYEDQVIVLIAAKYFFML
jgi:hypothetical protein